MAKTKTLGRPSFFNRMLNSIERVGNKLPDPATLFISLAVIVVLASGLCAMTGVSAVHPGTGDTINVYNLFSKEGIRYMWSNAVTNYSGYAPMGMVLVTVIGAGVAEKSGFFITLMKQSLATAPKYMITFILIFIGININGVGDAGFVVLPPLAAIIFISIGRSPLLGMFATYAAVASGFCANMMIGMSDTLAYSFTEPAARIIDPSYSGSPLINYYFLFVSAILLSIAGTLVTEKIMAPRFEGVDMSKYIDTSMPADDVVTPDQKKALKAAGVGFLVTVLVILSMCIGNDPVLGLPGEGPGSIMNSNSPFMKGIIVGISILLFVPGAIYGFVSKKYTKDKHLFSDMASAFKDMAPYVMLCFFSAQFTSYFAKSNLGAIVAIKGAGALSQLNVHPVVLLIALIFITCLINLLMGSASAKWAIFAPVFVPMLMLLNLDPAVTQIAYRIGDSITNPLTPISAYLALLLGVARRYEKDTGLGTIIANMFPYSVTFAGIWIVQLIVWVMLKLPLGPGGGIYLA